MKVKVEVTEYVSYSAQEPNYYEYHIMWDSNEGYLYLDMYRDENVLEFLKQKNITDDVEIEYCYMGYYYVA